MSNPIFHFFRRISGHEHKTLGGGPSAALQGTICALIAAICYGLLPTLVLPMSESNAAANPEDFMPNLSILFYRFMSAAVIIGLVMVIKRKSFRITRGELVTLLYLAFLSDGSALFLFGGYQYMSTGVATTLHFMYPAFTTILMMMFYNEARKLSTIIAVTLAVVGVGVLSWQSDGTVDWRGVIIELISALCYALYLIRVNRSRVRDMDALKMTFYIMLLGAMIFMGYALLENKFEMITTQTQLVSLSIMGLVSTVVTNLCLIVAVKNIGSTMTSVLGALEPLTAVTLGLIFFNEPLTTSILIGLSLIIPAVIMIIFTRGRK
ncbi:DMT family transporter [Alloprevotella tannerae]